MDTTKIVHYLPIQAPAARVSDALTRREGLSSWWTSSVEVADVFGGVLRFEFFPEFNPAMEILTPDVPRHVEWKCVDGHAPWLGHHFLFDVREQGETSAVLFVQSCAAPLALEAYGTYNFNWGFYLASLKRLCETGVGKPFQVQSS